ncbi:MAG: hypothetical protein Q4B40_06635 [Clostridia bacterium]|nr:hypothetical protein [Clostridia bacterium]
MNNETIGISAELAIADVFDISVSPTYRIRGDEAAKKSLMDLVCRVFYEYEIPKPIEHIAENQSPIDFILEYGETLSVKTNQKALGKVAPQIIGQPTSETYFDFLYNRFGYDVYKELASRHWHDTHENRAFLFKEFSFNNICEMLSEYWKHIFECDHYIHFYNILDGDRSLSYKPNCIILKNLPTNPFWDINKISFTRNLQTWNESNVLKYCGISIGEFQAHNHRNCLKFRFNINGILKLLERNLI